MNNKPLAPAELEKTLASKLRDLLGEAAWLHQPAAQMAKPDAGFDFLAGLPLPGGGRVALCVACKSELRPSLFRPFVARTFLPAGNYKAVVRTLALPWISPRIAELCAEHGWSWFDLAGNHRLDVPGLLRLQRTGNPPVHSSPKPTANLSTPEAGRVIRVLLLPDNTGIRWTQRAMKNHCRPNVSLGLVNKVIRHLRDEAFIEESDEGFHLRDPRKLLFAWRDAYRFDRHERRSYFTLLQGKKLRETLYRFGLHVNLSAYALANRDKPKDADDICFVLDNYPHGLGELASNWKKQARKKNVVKAVAILSGKFADVGSYGPAPVVEFHGSASAEARAQQARRAFELVQEYLKCVG